jgi:hypothetical protein
VIFGCEYGRGGGGGDSASDGAGDSSPKELRELRELLSDAPSVGLALFMKPNHESKPKMRSMGHLDYRSVLKMGVRFEQACISGPRTRRRGILRSLACALAFSASSLVAVRADAQCSSNNLGE